MAIKELDLRKGSICTEILLNIEKSGMSNKELCLNIFGEINQNNRSKVNHALKRMEKIYYVFHETNLRKWKLGENGKYIVKIIKNLKKTN